MAHRLPYYKIILACALSFILSLVSTSYSYGAHSDWTNYEGGRARLWLLKEQNKNLIRAALEIELKPGWKSYWRAPGSSGFAPEIKLDQPYPSKMRFPLPELEQSGENFNNIYHNHLFIVIEITVTEPETPLSGYINFGLCKDLCLPARLPFNFSARDIAKQDILTLSYLSLAENALAKKPNDIFYLKNLKYKDGKIKAVFAYYPSASKISSPLNNSQIARRLALFFDQEIANSDEEKQFSIGPANLSTIKKYDNGPNSHYYEIEMTAPIYPYDSSDNGGKGALTLSKPLNIYYIARLNEQIIEGVKAIQ